MGRQRNLAQAIRVAWFSAVPAGLATGNLLKRSLWPSAVTFVSLPTVHISLTSLADRTVATTQLSLTCPRPLE